MLKRLSKILIIVLSLTIIMGAFTACKGGGANYSINDLSSHKKKVADYIVSPNVARIMGASGKTAGESVSSDVKNASSVNNIVNAGESVAHYNETKKAYDVMPASLYDLENAAKALADRVKPCMNKVINELPEENTWIGYGTEEDVLNSRVGASDTIFARVNTTTAGVMEYIAVNYRPEQDRVIGGTYIKLTDTDVENEPIVEYANVQIGDYELDAISEDKNLITGEVLYYVPGEQIYVWTMEHNGGNVYYCVNDDGHFTSFQASNTTNTIIDGNAEDGYIERIMENMPSEDRDSTIYNYYRDNHNIISQDYWGIYLDLYYADNVNMQFSEPTIKKTEATEQETGNGVSTTGAFSYYSVEKDILGCADLHEKVAFDAIEDNEKYAGTFKTDIDIEVNWGDGTDTKGVEYYVTKDGIVKIGRDQVTTGTIFEFSEEKHFNDRTENNNMCDRLFSEARFNEMYGIYETYFNADCTILDTKAQEAIAKIDVPSGDLKCSYDFKGFASKVKTLDAHYKYSASSSSLVENYPTQIEAPDFDRYYFNSQIVCDYDDSNPKYIFDCQFNGYDVGGVEAMDLILAISKDGELTEIGHGDRDMTFIGNESNLNTTCVIRLAYDILPKIEKDGKLECGRYDVVAYCQDVATKENHLDSLTPIIGRLASANYDEYAIEYKGSYYNIKFHNHVQGGLNFDKNMYILVEEIK